MVCYPSGDLYDPEIQPVGKKIILGSRLELSASSKQNYAIDQVYL